MRPRQSHIACRSPQTGTAVAISTTKRRRSMDQTMRKSPKTLRGGSRKCVDAVPEWRLHVCSLSCFGPAKTTWQRSHVKADADAGDEETLPDPSASMGVRTSQLFQAISSRSLWACGHCASRSHVAVTLMMTSTCQGRLSNIPGLGHILNVWGCWHLSRAHRPWT